jgi:hypothetical protein
MDLLKKLEEVKQLGCYSVNLVYGEGDGCDDSDVPMEERRIQLVCSPVGYLGSMRAYYKGTVKSFLEFDFSSTPTLVSNPPDKDQMEEDGLYCWGTEQSVDAFKRTNKLFPFQKN